jgi:hypothetical protein
MEHKDDTECVHRVRSRYVKVINKDGASVTTKVVVKQLRYIPITPRLKRLFLCEETVQQMRWHKEGIRDREVSILCHILRMPRLGTLWTVLIQNLEGTPRVSILVYRWMVSNLTALIVLCTLASQFL